MISTFKRLASALVLLPLAACWDSSGPRPLRPFDVFLVMGGSNAAGVEGAGISSSTQARAWPALLAQHLGAPFVYAALEEPGCPPPYFAPLQRDPGKRACSGGAAPSHVAMLSSVAIPGAQLSHAFAYAGTPLETMNVMMLGAHTQLEVLAERSPTFVAIQFGDDELQSALRTGDVSAIPSTAQFEGDLDRLVAALNALDFLQGVLIVGIMDPLRLPLVQPGAYFFLARDPATGRYLNRPVNNNCSPVTQLGTVNPLARNLVSMSIVNSNALQIDCDPAHGGIGLLDQNELATIRQRAESFNNALSSTAAQHGWAFLDVQALLLPRMLERNAQGRYNQVRLCQDLPVATSAAQFQAAVLNSCPVTGTTAAPNFFGALFSLDGTTLSAAGHTLLADAAAAVILQRYPD